MQHHHMFRFCASPPPVRSLVELAEFGRKAEALGFDAVAVGDHITLGGLGPISGLAALASSTTRLKLSSHVFTNAFRNPALLAHEAATIDLLSGGRLELGIGAGWYRRDFEALGLPYEGHAVRFARLVESVTLIKRLLREDSVSHEGTYYTVRDLTLDPRPALPPRLFIGGGGRRTLQLAACEADIVGIDLQGVAAGVLDARSITEEAVAEKVTWVREAAGDRLEQLELHLLIHHVVVTDDLRQGAELVRARLAGFSAMATNLDLTEEQIHDSPHVLLGSVDQIVEKLLMLRERYGISYFGALSDLTDALAPVVARLA
jgi:probable F420-dependent oxidoreductase